MQWDVLQITVGVLQSAETLTMLAGVNDCLLTAQESASTATIYPAQPRSDLAANHWLFFVRLTGDIDGSLCLLIGAIIIAFYDARHAFAIALAV